MTSSAAAAPPKTTPLAWLLGFIGPCLPFAALGLPLAVTLPEYLANHVGLSLQVVSLMFLTLRAGDLFIDPFIGGLMDRTRTRFGRFKVWMALCVPILMTGTAMVFFAPVGSSAQHLMLGLFIIYVGFSIAALSQSGWGAALSSDYAERAKIFAFWQVGNVAGIIIVAFIPVFVQSVLHRTYVEGVEAMGAFILIALPVMVGLALWITPEQVSSAEVKGVRWGEYFTLLKDKNVRRILMTDLFMGLAPGVMGVLFYFFFEQTKGLVREQSTIAIGLYFIAGAVGAPFWSWAAKLFGKHRTLIASSLTFAALYAGLFFTPAGAVQICMIMVFAAGLPYASSLLLTRAMMADLGDVLRLETGHDHKGVLMSFLSVTTKLGYALSVFSLFALSQLGFDNRAVRNTPQALAWLQAFFIGLPVLFSLLGAAAMSGYDLSRKRFEQVHAALQDT